MKQNFEKDILDRIHLVAAHFETPKKLKTFTWKGTSLLQYYLVQKGILVRTDVGLYKWKRNPDGITPLPVTARLAKTIIENIRLKQASYNDSRRMRLIIKNRPIPLWQKILNWFKS